ncbi:MAG: hypothetical protein WHS89_07015 [Acidimicrobiales bacterium]
MLSFVRSRMFTTAFRFFAGLAVFGWLGALTQAFTSDQSIVNAIVGPLSIGWKGGVGNHFTYTVLMSLTFVAAAMGVLLVALRDADPEAEAQVLHTESVPLTRAPAGTNFLPMVGAFAAGVLVVGQITNKYVTIAGLALLVAVIGVWMLRAWAERATGDDEINREIYQRFIEPFRVPILSAICIAVVVLALSRVLLAVSETASIVVFASAGALFLLGAALVAARPQISRNAITLLLFFAAIVVIVAGILAGLQGQRDFEKHGSEDHGALTQDGVSEPAGVTEGSLGTVVIDSSSRGAA